MRILKSSLLLLGVIFIIAVTTAMVLGVRGSGNVIRETREVSGFTKIVITTPGDVVIRQGERESLTIEGDDNLLPYYITEVDGDTLTIRTKPNTTILSLARLHFEITVQDLESVELDGVANIALDEIDVAALHIQMNGTGNISATGSAQMQTVETNGAGNYDASDLITDSTKIWVNGVGNATVNAAETLDVSVNGLGGVEYIGKPSVSQHINGLGYINAAH
jgi:hypothetical protein